MSMLFEVTATDNTVKLKGYYGTTALLPEAARKLALTIDQAAIEVLRKQNKIGIHKAEHDKGDDIA